MKPDFRPDEQLNRNQWWGRYSIRHHVKVTKVTNMEKGNSKSFSVKFDDNGNVVRA